MLKTEEFQQERAELDAILRSGIFSRAPHLVSFLTYICRNYFEGRAAEIKEYTIGVEALGRRPGFDPKKDSIVRVEAHRLRKRLNDYYAAQGADHAIHIVIPSGQYIPRFILRDQIQTCAEPLPEPALSFGQQVETALVPAASLPLPALSEERAVIAAPPVLVGRRRLGMAAVSVAILCAIGVVTWRAQAKRQALPPSGNEIWSGSSIEPVPAEFRILTGYHGPPFIDRQGHTWNPDGYFSGGHSLPFAPGRAIEGQPDPHLLKASRTGEFHYDIPLGKGTYELHLYFAETEYGPGNPRGGGEASRVFQISINGIPALRSFDPLAESGFPNRMHERVFKDISPGPDGKLRLAFAPLTGPAVLNALEILPSAPGLIRPIRIVAQDRPLTDSQGRIWSADQYFSGGTLVLRRNTVLDAKDKALYRGERYGHFTYRIPLAPGKYRLALHFAETWFGSPESHQPALGSRLFNVFANGVTLLENFEIAKLAGQNRELIKVFENLVPNAQGVLSLEFVPVENYAEVNAIEIVETE